MADLFSEEARKTFAVSEEARRTAAAAESAKDRAAAGKGGAGKASKNQKKSKKAGEQRRRDTEADSRTVFCSNVPLGAKKGAIKQHFVAFGTVESVRLRSIPITGAKVAEAGNHSLVRKVSAIKGNIDKERRNSMNAYVVFAKREEALAAIEALNGEKFEEHRLRLDMADKSTGLQDHRKSVFICNFPSGMTEDDLWEYFEAKLGGGSEAEKGRVVTGVRIVRDRKTQQVKGFGYLHLVSPTYATAALALHKTQLKKRELRVFPCRREEKKPERGAADAAGPQKRSRSESDAPAFLGTKIVEAQRNALKRLRRKKERKEKAAAKVVKPAGGGRGRGRGRGSGRGRGRGASAGAPSGRGRGRGRGKSIGSGSRGKTSSGKGERKPRDKHGRNGEKGPRRNKKATE